MEQVKLVSEATKGELEAALAALDDPHKKFKEALKAGKRVRHCNGPWIDDAQDFAWDCPPEDYEIETGQPELYCGYTEEQWQFVIDGGFDVKVSDGSLAVAKNKQVSATLIGMDTSRRTPFRASDGYHWGYCHIVRRKNHPQPAFGRSVEDSDWVVAHYEEDSHDLLQSEGVDWIAADWFINLSRGG